MDLPEFLRIVRRNLFILIAFVLVGTIIGAAVSLLQPRQYQAKADIFVTTAPTATLTDLSNATMFTQQVVKSYVSVAPKQSVLQTVIDTLHLKITPEQLASQVAADATANTSVIELTVNNIDPKTAAAVANAWSTSLQSIVRNQLAPSRYTGATKSTATTPAVRLVPVQKASVPTVPSSPNLPLDLFIGALIGLVLGALATALRESLDTRMRSERDVQSVTKRPVLGAIPFDSAAGKGALLTPDGPGSALAESYRALRTNLQFVDFERGQRTMVITSSVAREGKSTTTLNLAAALADAGTSVLVVDADLRRPKIAEYLGIEGAVGLTDVLVGRVSLDGAIQRVGERSLSVLPAGQIPPNPSELLQSRTMAQLIGRLSSQFEVVLFDAPPLLPVTDAAILSHRADGALVVAGAKRVNRQQLKAALASLEQVGADVLGLVITMAPKKGPDAYGYGRGNYGQAPTAAAAAPVPLDDSPVGAGARSNA